jgi:hypothetical protein
MAPKIVPISKRPLESYDYDHVMSREKKIIVEELISEYNNIVKSLSVEIYKYQIERFS